MKAMLPSPTLTASLVALITIPRSILAGEWPNLPVDADTISPCVMWEDNANDLLCEEVREYWNITPEAFSRWNLSVGLDCKPWRGQSYCVVPLARLPTTTSSEIPTATTISMSSTSTLGPSPTRLSTLGCYTDESTKYSAFEELMSKEGGDDDLTIAKCKIRAIRPPLSSLALRMVTSAGVVTTSSVTWQRTPPTATLLALRHSLLWRQVRDLRWQQASECF